MYTLELLGDYPCLIQLPPAVNSTPKKGHPWLWFMGGGCLVILLIFGGCAAIIGVTAKGASDAVSSASAEAEKVHTIELQATANGEASVNYGPLGSLSNEDFEDEWSKTIEAKGKDTYTIGVSPKFQSGTDSISCSVIIDGEEVEHEEATGENAHVTCSKPLDYGFSKDKK